MVTGQPEKPRRVFQTMVDARGRELRELAYDHLLLLDPPQEVVQVNGCRGQISVIVEPCVDDRVRIIIQGFLNCGGLLGAVGFKDVALDGFYKHRDNSVEPMQDDEFYGYD